MTDDNHNNKQENFDTDGEFLRVGSFNIRGATTPGKMESLCLWGEKHRMNIIGIQETNLTKQTTKGLFQVEGSDRQTDKHKHYTIFWDHGQKQNNGKKTAHLGTGVGLLMDKYWTAHVARRVTCGGRGVSVDFSFKTGFQLRVINCYVPSKNNTNQQELEAIERWTQTEYRGAQQGGLCVIWMGDFNGVCNPQVDRARVQSGSTRPETDLLEWIGTQALFDHISLHSSHESGFYLSSH